MHIIHPSVHRRNHPSFHPTKSLTRPVMNLAQGSGVSITRAGVSPPVRATPGFYLNLCHENLVGFLEGRPMKLCGPPDWQPPHPASNCSPNPPSKHSFHEWFRWPALQVSRCWPQTSDPCSVFRSQEGSVTCNRRSRGDPCQMLVFSIFCCCKGWSDNFQSRYLGQLAQKSGHGQHTFEQMKAHRHFLSLPPV